MLSEFIALLFGNGQDGYYFSIPKPGVENGEKKTVSAKDLYAYHFMIHPNTFTYLKLSHQYAVDMNEKLNQRD